MAILNEISVVEGDLRKEYPDLERLLYEDAEFDLTSVILDVKKVLYGILKAEYKLLNPAYTDAEVETDLDKVKDLTEENLKRKIQYLTLSKLMIMNDNFEAGAVYENLADQIPLLYYIDDDSDSVVDKSEETFTQEKARFHR